MSKLSEILKQVEGTEDVLIHSEELSWLTTLLQLVDVTQPGAEEHLMKFFKSKCQVVKTHRAQLVKYVCKCAGAVTCRCMTCIVTVCCFCL